MSNYRFPAQFDYGAGGPITKARANIAAIELLQQLDQRAATSAEQQILAQYVGWGGLPQIFNPHADGTWGDLGAQLKDLLTEDQWQSAFASTLDAHYTAPDVIRPIYQGLEHLGFTGGRILEPSMGTGNFLGLMPRKMAKNSEITGIELDEITGQIAQKLYPDADLHIRGFEKTLLAPETFDLAIGNVPFGDYQIADPTYDHLKLPVHNYFIARSMDLVRPGGLVAFITSTGTLQSKNGQTFRAWLSERSNLVGAMRLPGDAFKAAGTSVTTDLLVLQKLGPEQRSEPERWLTLENTPLRDSNDRPLKTNEYFIKHPANQLGELANDKLHPGRLALVSDGRDLPVAIAETFSSFPANIYQPDQRPQVEESDRQLLPQDSPIKNFGYVARDGEIWQRQGYYLEKTALKGKKAARISGMLDIRDAANAVFDVQINRGGDDELAAAQTELNDLYDKFVKKHGRLCESANTRVIRLDPDAQLLQALETRNKETNELEKSAIFSERTVRARTIKTHADTSQEALLTSLNEYGKIVPGYMADLLGQDESTVLADLSEQNLIFLDPESHQWQTEDEYLSGSVRAKLKTAESAAALDPQYERNVAALQGVQPRDLGPGEIDIKLGAPWIPPEVIEDFARDLLGVAPNSNVRVSHNSAYGAWSVDAHPTVAYRKTNTHTHGTDQFTALELIQLSLNLKDATVHFTDGGKRRVDVEPTLAARMAQQKIGDRFKSWVWQDFERSQLLTDRYNELFNGTVTRNYSNHNLEMPGSNPAIELRPHQKNAVWRSLQSQATLMAHEVGAGKTFSLAASAMEMRRLGLANKPMLVVPNHMLQQFTNEFQELYPNAKILAPGEKETDAANRRELMARIATGNWDAVIVTHSAFTLLPISVDTKVDFYRQQADELESMLQDPEIQNNGIVKQLAREQRKLQTKINKITDASEKDTGVTFEQLGVDALLVDEAHFWKNLGRNSKLQSITGLSNTNSQRAQDAFIKVSALRESGGRIVFATGTPISNSIAEMYTMQRFLQPESLARQGLESFDGWVGAFAEKVTAPEIDATGKFKTKTRLTKFTNVPELMTLFKEVADIKTTAELQLPVPKVTRITVATEASDIQLGYMDRLIARAEAVSKREVEPKDDNMLLITTDGRRSALDMRLVSPEIPDHPQSKVNQAISNIHEIWQSTEADRLTQMVFCDLGTPKAAKAGEPEPWSVYAAIKQGLIAKGVPADEIAFIHDAPKDKDKEILYGKVNKGQVRVLLGSTEKCGVGMNIQKKLIAEHHIDAPWRPSDIAQREGRIIRQGNQNDDVMVLTYVTQGKEGKLGFDSYSWQTLSRKAEMVEQVMRGDDSMRSVDDISGAALSYDEVKAIATGNPLILEKATVDGKVIELSRYQQTWMSDRYNAQTRLERVIPHELNQLGVQIQAITTDIANRPDTSGDNFSIQIGSRTFTERGPAGDQILAALQQARQSPKLGVQDIGEFAGMTLVLRKTFKGTDLLLRSSNDMHYPINGGETGLGVVRSMEHTLKSLPNRLAERESAKTDLEQEFEALSQTLEQPFEYADELAGALARKQEIDTELGLYKQDQQAVADGPPESGERSDGKEKEIDDLVDLDNLVSVDADWNWQDAAAEVNQAPCTPTPELIATLEKLGFREPAPVAVEATAPDQPSVEPVAADAVAAAPSETPAQSQPPQSPAPDPTTWPLIAAALGRTPQYQATIADRLSQHVLGQPWDQRVELAFNKDLQRFNTQLNTLRDWYGTARELGRGSEYLAGIQAVGEAFKQGCPLTAEHQAQQQGDHYELSYKNFSRKFPKNDPEFLNKLATEAVNHGFDQKQTMRVLRLSPQIQEIHKTEGEQASLKVSRQAMLHGLRHKTKVSTVQFTPQAHRSLHR